ncbi:hypothetical protein B5X24_HaOG209002 [Helicoverpa armigera]|uniref:Uncharacterized protein n=1 Tax=Helicoverpa armigera TaxID=29058 RepID=A0A2W1BEW4_HELAM|nr:hypothetical protein B5X24_HaOG209002 [Helicoverpa armigera]
MSRLTACWLIVLLVYIKKTSCVCDARCSGDRCYSGFTGSKCMSTCVSSLCASGCIGQNCSSTCNGLQCTAGCTGDYCTATCIGLSCKAFCEGTGYMGKEPATSGVEGSFIYYTIGHSVLAASTQLDSPPACCKRAVLMRTARRRRANCAPTPSRQRNNQAYTSRPARGRRADGERTARRRRADSAWLARWQLAVVVIRGDAVLLPCCCRAAIMCHKLKGP